MRTCQWCGKSIEHKKANAKFCSRIHKQSYSKAGRRPRQAKLSWHGPCAYCGADLPDTKKFCGVNCRTKSHYHSKTNQAKRRADKVAREVAKPGKLSKIYLYTCENPSCTSPFVSRRRLTADIKVNPKHKHCVKWRERQSEAYKLRRATGNRARIPYKEWQATLEHFEHACAYCRNAEVKLEKDHVWPSALGGKDEVKNLVPACRSCNASKGDSEPWNWVIANVPSSNRLIRDWLWGLMLHNDKTLAGITNSVFYGYTTNPYDKTQHISLTSKALKKD